MADQGADVVILDMGWDLLPDLIPVHSFDMETMREEQAYYCASVVNAWWYLRRDRGHTTRAVYAPIYALPPDLGRHESPYSGASSSTSTTHSGPWSKPHLSLTTQSSLSNR